MFAMACTSLIFAGVVAARRHAGAARRRSRAASSAARLQFSPLAAPRLSRPPSRRQRSRSATSTCSSALARLVFVLASSASLIAPLANPWRENRPSDRFPAIVQDVALIGAVH